MYQYLDAVIVRAPALDARGLGLPWPDLTSPDATVTSWRAWLGQAWQAPELASAVEDASPDLARQVNRILSCHDVPEAAVRRTVMSTLRYVLRGITRATPFGLLAGIAPARIGPRAAFMAGTGHRAVARPDATWLTGVIEALEADDGLRPSLTVAASCLVTERNGHLVISHRPGGSGGGTPERVQVRAIPPVRAALDAAQSPVGVSDLAAKLAAGFPEATSDMITGLIARLISLGFLLTSLRAPITSPDPLSALTAELEPAVPHDEARIGSLRAVSASLARHNSAPDPVVARNERHHAAALMTSMRPAPGPALAVDLRLDWNLAIPEEVAAEAARAAGVLARLARRPALSPAWTAWHARFLDRYGPGAVVSVLEVVSDSTGLGFPAGYLGSTPAGQKSPLASRDKTLLKLAQRAVIRGEHEITLDDALIEELSAVSPGDPLQPSAELTVRVHAASVQDLDEGAFTLHVMGVSRGAGTVTGRFLHLLGRADQQRMCGVYASLPGVFLDSVPVQISAAPLYARSGNVARVPQTAGVVVSLGEHRADSPAQRIPISDLAVAADARRLHLMSVSRRRPVHTILPSAVDLTIHAHPLARFLLEAPVALAAPCAAFDWGAAHALPFVPALRYGQTILSPARWILDADDLAGREAAFSRWDDTLATWARQARLPRRVYAGDGDRCIALDLAEPSHRALLRAETNRAGRTRLRAAPAPGDLGWADGCPHEITIPLAAAGPAAAPVRWHGEVTRRGHGHLPGCDRRIYLKLYGPRDLQDAVLTRHLPEFAARLGRNASWWFIRYDDPEPHLRIRFTLGDRGFGVAVGQVGAWTSELRESGLVTGVNWDTYYPESARFGGASVMAVAEAFFAADSAAAVAQLTVPAGKDGPDARALTAASMTDLTAAAIGDDTEAMRWLVNHAKTGSVPPPRAVYDQAVALVCGPGRPAATGCIAPAWRVRRAALAAYRNALDQAGTVSLTDLLPDLLHLHQARIAGPDIESERACLHLARAAALSWLARNQKKAS
jgi:thiopeptide-type bacteriocin biosynthesis protein